MVTLVSLYHIHIFLSSTFQQKILGSAFFGGYRSRIILYYHFQRLLKLRKISIFLLPFYHITDYKKSVLAESQYTKHQGKCAVYIIYINLIIWIDFDAVEIGRQVGD